MTRILHTILIFILGLGLQLPAYESKATAFQLLASQTEYRSMLSGSWQVVSEVIWSKSKYAQKGSVSESEIIISDIHGSLYPEWKTDGWQLVRNKSIDLNADKSIHWERESKLTINDEYWFVSSVNKFKYTSDGKIEGKSYHKQYLNGEYVGSYITYSKLKRKNNSFLAIK
jgi:hypothetical protein